MYEFRTIKLKVLKWPILYLFICLLYLYNLKLIFLSKLNKEFFYE